MPTRPCLTARLLHGTPAEFKAALGNSPVHIRVMNPGQKADF